MSFFSKIGKALKKVAGFALPAIGGMMLPGIGSAVGSMFSGIGSGPVELKGDGSVGSSDGWSWGGLGNAVGGMLNSDGFQGALAGGLSYAGARETNAANVLEAQKNRDFQAAQAQQQMDFQSNQAQRSMDFSGSQAEKQMAFQERMANSAMQRGAADMKAAGFNPMLSMMKGGADVPSGAAGSGAMGQGASGHGAQAQVANALGSAVSSALSANRMQFEISNMKAQNRLIESQANETDARALESAVRLPKIQAETVEKAVNANRISADIDRIKADTERLKDEREYLIQRTTTEKLTGEQKAYYNLFIQQYDRAIKESQARLMALSVPGAENVSAAQASWWMREVSPYLPDILRGASSAGQLKGLMK